MRTAEPTLAHPPLAPMQAFISGLQQTLGAMEKEVGAALSAFHQALPAALSAAEVPPAAIAGLEAAQCNGHVSALQGTVADMKEAANKQQRELSRSLEPLVQQHMVPGCAPRRSMLARAQTCPHPPMHPHARVCLGASPSGPAALFPRRQCNGRGRQRFAPATRSHPGEPRDEVCPEDVHGCGRRHRRANEVDAGGDRRSARQADGAGVAVLAAHVVRAALGRCAA